MNWWPGWNSIEGASRGETFFWWLGITCLILLATSEIISRRYGHRKDELVAISQRAQTEERQRTEQETLQRHEAQITALKRSRDRLLSSEQARDLGNWLKQYPGHRYWLITQSNDQDERSEQMRLSQQLIEILDDSGWIRAVRLLPHSTNDLPRFGMVSDRGMNIFYLADELSSQQRAEALSLKFEACNLECIVTPRENIRSDMFVIEVALR